MEKAKETAATKVGKVYQKTLICIVGIAEKGKTATANEIINLLKRYATAKVLNQTYHNNGNQIEQFIVKISNQTIGVDCIGDPGTNFPARIDTLGAYPCDAVVCTTRTSGETLDAAQKTATKYNMLFIKTSTYQTDDPAMEATMNSYKAEHIIDLLKKRKHL